MKLDFQLNNNSFITVNINKGIIAGWAGRDIEAIEHHIQELQELGVPRPSEVPLFYRIAANQLLQEESIDVIGANTSGEAEVLIFNYENELFISLSSDHTDRTLEAHSVALSKQICAKPVAKSAWKYKDVADHWDQLQLKSWIEENGERTPYQDGGVSSLLHPLELLQKFFSAPQIPTNHVMICGTVPVIGGIRPSKTFTMQLHDPVLKRTIEHTYVINVLPEIS